MSIPDIEDEIREVWGIDETVVTRPFTFTQISGYCCYTKPTLLGNDRVAVEITYGDVERDRNTIVYHEGAHVYLFHLGYPPAKAEPEPALGSRVSDYIADYYAYKLQLEKESGNDPSKLIQLLNGKYIALGAAYNGAILARLKVFWKLAPRPTWGIGNFSMVYESLEKAPPPPGFTAQPFEKRAVKEIRRLLHDSFHKAHPGHQLKFL